MCDSPSAPPRSGAGLILFLTALVAAGGLYLRLHNNDFGLPREYHTDEKRKVAAIQRMFDNASGDPEYFNHPGFLLYTGAAVSWAAHRFVELPWNESTIYLAVRSWVGLLGGFTILAAFFLGRELAKGARDDESPPGNVEPLLAGFLAAAVMVPLPLAVVCGHYIKEDVPLTLWTTLTALFAVRVARTGRWRDYVFSVACAALAFSTKYIGALSFVLVLIAHGFFLGRQAFFAQVRAWFVAFATGARRTGLVALLSLSATLVARKHAPAWMTVAGGVGGALTLLSLVVWLVRWKRSGAALAMRLTAGWKLTLLAAGLFLLVNPYAILNARTFGADFDFENRHGLIKGHHGIRVSPWAHAWGFHLRHSLAPGMTLPVLAATLLALLVLLHAKDSGARFVGVAALFWYFAHEASYLKPPPNFDRYMNPVLPLLCAGLGYAWLRFLRRDARSSALATGLTFLCALALVVPPAVKSDGLVRQMKPDTRDEAIRWCLAEIPPGSRVLLSAYAPPFAETETPFEWRYASYMHVKRSDEGPLDLATGLFPLDHETWRVDYVITSSFWTSRYFLFKPEELEGRHDTGRAFYEDLERRWGPPVRTFTAPLGPYGYNNPTIRVYRRPRPGETVIVRSASVRKEMP